MEELLGIVGQYIYMEVVLAVILVTQVLKKYLNFRVHAKWYTLAAAVVVLVASVVYRGADWNGWTAVISVLFATASYDYLVKPMAEKFGWVKGKR